MKIGDRVIGKRGGWSGVITNITEDGVEILLDKDGRTARVLPEWIVLDLTEGGEK